MDLEKQFRLTREFWFAYAILAAPVIVVAKPWTWQLPAISQIAAYAFLPFAAVIVTYSSVAFIAAVIHGTSKERKIGVAFLASVGSSAFFLVAVWWLDDFGSLPSVFGVAAVIIANVVFAFVRAKKA